MADPHIKCELDLLDKLTVVLYRSALTIAAVIMAIIGYETIQATPFLIIVALLASTKNLIASSIPNLSKL